MIEASAHSAGFIEAVEQTYPLGILETLLMDRTTGRNIIWADSEYEARGEGYAAQDEITTDAISGLNSGVIKPRIAKEQERQSRRTKSRAEVFTPSWLCNQMNNHLDEDWFGRSDVFNTQEKNGWTTKQEKVTFPDDSKKDWKSYVDCRKLEITCGEAPFICSRYDTVSGAEIDVMDRIGFLDRKLRVVSENNETYDEWLAWAYRAMESTYGYEYQGDNLLIARINVLQTFVEFMQDKWNKQPDESEIYQVAKIVSWNIWQMDGLKGAVPSDKPIGDERQMSLFDLAEDIEERQAPFCKIYDWRAKTSQTYVSMKSEG